MHSIIVSVSRALAATCLFASASIAFAQVADQAPAAEAPHRHGPSPEAFAACASKAANDTCSFSAHRGTITGQCATPRMKPAADTSGGAGAGSTAAASGGTNAAGGSAKPAQLVCRPDHAANHEHAHDNSGGN